MGSLSTLLPLRAGDTILIEATLTYDLTKGRVDPDDRVLLKVGDPRYGQAASVKPEQVHGIVRRYFTEGESVLLEGPEYIEATILAIDGAYAWVRRDDGSRSTVSTLSLRPAHPPVEDNTVAETPSC